MRLTDIFGTYVESNKSTMNSQTVLSENLFDQLHRDIRRVLKPGRTLNLTLDPPLAGDLLFLLQLVEQTPGITVPLKQSASAAMAQLEQLINAELAQNVVEIEQKSPDLLRQRTARTAEVERAQEELERAQQELERLEALIESNYGQLKYIDEFQQRMGLKVAIKTERTPNGGSFRPATLEENLGGGTFRTYSLDSESPFEQLPMPPAGNGDRSNPGHF